MTALVDYMRDKYGANIRMSGIRDGLCVGGAFCLEFHDDIDWWQIAVDENKSDGDPNEITYGQKRYPYSDTLSAAMRQVFEGLEKEETDHCTVFSGLVQFLAHHTGLTFADALRRLLEPGNRPLELMQKEMEDADVRALDKS